MLERPANPHNFGSRRQTPISMVVIHSMQGTLPGTLAVFERAGTGVSAHYCVGSAGEIVRSVSDDYAAFHAGNGPINERSIGVELEGFTGKEGFPSPAQLKALQGLLAGLCISYDIPQDRSHIIGHCEVPDPRDPSRRGGLHHHTDPGESFPWAELMAGLTPVV